MAADDVKRPWASDWPGSLVSQKNSATNICEKRTKCMLMGMEIVGITMGVMGWIVSIVACALFTSGLMDFPQYRECTKCTQRNMNMSKVEVIIFRRIFLILAGLIHLILIFLVALDLTLNSDHENFLRSNNLMFSAEFNRWAASLLLIGGTIFCRSFIKKKA
ncbi:unnamed protein product [Coregonus sp. 'balchen']|nr:unnamed protein product [Coregonus sp. 'balchen']